jgi:hypothetical protein
MRDPKTLAHLGEGARRAAARFTLDRHLDRLELIFSQGLARDCERAARR